jgi:hypothetical protein
MLSEEGGRYRAPIGKYKSVVKAILGLLSTRLMDKSLGRYPDRRKPCEPR